MVYFLFPEAFFGLFAFLVVALLRAFFAGLAALLVDVLAALVVEAADGAAAADAVVDDLVDFFAALLFAFGLAFDAPAADFFFGDAAFFFGLLALALPAAFALVGAFAFGLADPAVLVFLALLVAFFLVAAAAAEAVGAAEEAAFVVVAVLLVVLALAAFFVGAFFVGEAERFRLLAAPVDFDLLDDRAFFVFVPAAGFLVPPGVFDRLRGFDAVDFLPVDFFLPPDDALFFGAVAFNLKLPLAPIPFVCFNVLFFVPARKADLRC